jgi:hypothetical protein
MIQEKHATENIVSRNYPLGAKIARLSLVTDFFNSIGP